MRKSPFITFLLAVAFSGCDDAQNRAQLASLNSNVLKFAAELGDLENRVEHMNSRPSAILDPTGKGYSFFDCEAGRLLVSCEEVNQYLDGQKIKFLIGNPLSMTLNGFKLKVRYGKRMPPFPKSPDANALSTWKSTWEPARDAWQETLREKEASFTEVLSPGRWTRVEMVISPAKVEEVAYLELTLHANQVMLLPAQ